MLRSPLISFVSAAFLFTKIIPPNMYSVRYIYPRKRRKIENMYLTGYIPSGIIWL